MQAVLAALDDAAALDLTWHDVPAAPLVELALERGVTTYDASYLWLARRLGARLVTFDARLARAAER